ncbi:MAG: hypothetical protein AB1611_16680 [bacterium]
MPEETNYFDKYLEAQFTQINASMSELKTQFGELKNQFAEVKEDNKSTRHWILGSAITFFVGFIAAAIAIFFGFAQLQTSWIQTVISFVSKVVVK